MRRLIINGDEIYEVDEDCLREKCEKEREKKILQNKQNTRSINNEKIKQKPY